ncbi:hypothetical protein FOG51_00779 [Hanseniaspora uvarum]|nr:hypothetical protein FOG48_00759 [Hanseniaspora uvarum]KAF0274144.1 hypothetical protein FOG51_00779 [Hanseniaspora uvarum]KAF0278835.1 hypothetical protein FOG50_00306 [Hanseniaspora uvarum]GMM39293.1 hypothetical protein DAHU10_001940 [Hanseniaspora uvarum]
MSSKMKKVFALTKALEEQIKFEIGYSSSQKIIQNPFRILDNRSFDKENSKYLILYKNFVDQSLNKQYEMFVKTDLSALLKYDYSIDNEKIEEKLENLITGNKFSSREYEMPDGGDKTSSFNISKGSKNISEEYVKLHPDDFLDVTVEHYDTFYTKLIKTDVVIRSKIDIQKCLYIETMIDFEEKSLYIERIMPFMDKNAVNDNNLIVVPKPLLKNETKTQTALIKGPPFAYMDPTIQENLYDLFKNWGIMENKQFIIDIFKSAELKEQDLYLDWLFRLKDHLSTSSK